MRLPQQEVLLVFCTTATALANVFQTLCGSRLPPEQEYRLCLCDTVSGEVARLGAVPELSEELRECVPMNRLHALLETQWFGPEGSAGLVADLAGEDRPWNVPLMVPTATLVPGMTLALVAFEAEEWEWCKQRYGWAGREDVPALVAAELQKTGVFERNQMAEPARRMSMRVWFSMVTPGPSICHGCGRGHTVSLKKCAGCGQARYCSAACQAMRWGQHKGVCNIIHRHARGGDRGAGASRCMLRFREPPSQYLDMLLQRGMRGERMDARTYRMKFRSTDLPTTLTSVMALAGCMRICRDATRLASDYIRTMVDSVMRHLESVTPLD